MATNMTLRKYITKSRSNHYTAVVKDGSKTVFKQGKLSNKAAANYLADQFILEYR